MTLSGRPLLDNPVDNKLFVDRNSELTALTTAVARRLNCLLVGEAGIGKTTVVRGWMYQARAERPDLAITYVRAAGATGGAELLAAAVARVTSTEPAVDENRVDWPGITAQIAERRDSVVRDLDDAGQAVAEGLRLVIVVDDVDAPAGHELFGRWRDELWELGALWVVCCRPETAAVLTQPPADAFFERTVHVGPLGVRSGADLLQRRHRISQADALRIADAAQGNPRRMLDAARQHWVEGTPVKEVLATQARREEALHAIGRPAVMLARALRDSGGAASASDPELLQRLGWTRPRVVQVMAQLEDAGLVTATTVKDGPGRPRRVYRLARSGGGEA
jgi:hypothetical protein